MSLVVTVETLYIYGPKTCATHFPNTEYRFRGKENALRKIRFPCINPPPSCSLFFAHFFTNSCLFTQRAPTYRQSLCQVGFNSDMGRIGWNCEWHHFKAAPWRGGLWKESGEDREERDVLHSVRVRVQEVERGRRKCLCVFTCRAAHDSCLTFSMR